MNTRRIVLALTLSLLPLVACESSGGRASDPARAMARLPENTRAAADGYISGLSDLTKQLTSVTDTSSARAAMPGIERAIGRVLENSDRLNGATAGSGPDIHEAFGVRLRNVNDDFAAQLDRIKGTPGIGPIMGPLLDKVRLYR